MTTLQSTGRESDVGTAGLPVPSGTGPPTGDDGTARRRWWPGFVCAAAYFGLVVAYFGPTNPFDVGHMTGPRAADQIIQIWWLDWAEYAIAHGHNLLFSKLAQRADRHERRRERVDDATRRAGGADHRLLWTGRHLERPDEGGAFRVGTLDVSGAPPLDQLLACCVRRWAVVRILHLPGG